jgi:hypothetical protein
MRWRNDTVTTEDSVAMPSAVSGRTLRDAFWTDIRALTFGLVRASDNSLRLGPLELIRLGPAKVTRTGVQWPIEGGLLTREPGGRLRFERLYGRLVASLDGYEPALPRLLYVLMQLPVHRLWTRLHLLRVRGPEPRPGVPADPSRRLAAATIDAAFCVALSAVVARRRRIASLLGVTAGYHVACWTISGTTLGGALMHQRVVAGDGSNVSATQALLRLAALPFGVWRRNIHDEIAGTDVVAL